MAIMVIECPECRTKVTAFIQQPQTRKNALKAGKLNLIHFADDIYDHPFSIELPSDEDHRNRILDEAELTGS